MAAVALWQRDIWLKDVYPTNECGSFFLVFFLGLWFWFWFWFWRASELKVFEKLSVGAGQAGSWEKREAWSFLTTSISGWYPVSAGGQ